jgi:predicted glycogen debranching enzyme
MKQHPLPGDFLLKWRGDTLSVVLDTGSPTVGKAFFRTDIGNASVLRRETIAATEDGSAPQAKAWTDIPMESVSPGVYRCEVKLDEIGVFSGKACFFSEGEKHPCWPEGADFRVKVASSRIRKGNSVYTVFPRQFGSFREVARRLPHIMDTMGFNIVQTLPPFPVPATYAVMGEYGCPFAATDFLSVDPAMAEFDERTTPLDQFRELIAGVHSREGLFFVDLPANHTGWASVLQTHHPEWFRRAPDGRFISPGAWGVVWADLVELDYSHAALREYMADVFLFWCRNGVDGFRCDAGYMIPAEAWRYIVARVREEYPDTVFMLEGLGGELSVTDSLLADAGLDWAYSEIFQTYDRGQFEWYLPGAAARAEKYGALIHFAETHDNDRLAKGGETYARLRVQLAALLSWQGAWGIANGVEWFCREKIDVHGRNDLSWGSERNMVALISRLNFILSSHPSFTGEAHLELLTRGDGNTLAVSRGDLLVLANLDCASGAVVDWDRLAAPAGEAFDLLSERKIDASRPVALGPGEVRCLQLKVPEPESVTASAALPDAAFRVALPRDASREVCVPGGELFEISSPSRFRAVLVDPESGRTLRTGVSSGEPLFFAAPGYEGDGTRCRVFRLESEIYGNGGVERVITAVLVPPPAGKAAVMSEIGGREVRRHPEWRTVLSNGAGAYSQLRLGWGTVLSQYDAVLAANPDPDVPSDRLNVWTRTRCWLQSGGYSREITAQWLVGFSADPAGRFAEWDFLVPCGTGGECALSFRVSLAEGRNAARLVVTRKGSGAGDRDVDVRLVFRPDIEWRSFHATTKAFQGAETRFPASTRPLPDGRGFVFSPYGGEFIMEVEGGVYRHECEWCYNVPHPEESARGQEGAGDLFSPGWISADLKTGSSVTLTGSLADGNRVKPVFPAAKPEAVTFAESLRRALSLFIVRRDGLKTVIAGYPWFLDWGRDTFIFMRGMIAAGMKDDALKILRAFAAFEDRGTLPNIIYGDTAGNRDTTDAQLWFIRCVEELGVKDEDLLRVSGSIVDNYISGTANGIRMDPESALVWSPSHFTWMDTNYPACTPRVGYPVEIQALWISALKFLGRGQLAAKALESLKRLFKWEHGYRDCLAAPNGESAAAAVPEDTVRPNQLFLVTLGIVDDPSIVAASGELVVPGGIRSLGAAHPLYRGVYEGDEDTCRKPAYHNGTVWAWPFPSYAEALVAVGAASRETALCLLASAVENLNSGCICHMSEIADGDAPHRQKGCTAQAWSVSELLRVWLKLGGR